jgi:vitamin B12 transporter
MFKYVLYIGLVFSAFQIIGQVQEKELNEVKVVKEQILKSNQDFVLKKTAIQSKHTDDLGDLLKHVPGIALKNYGGLGGLKTISARGINGAHTGIYVDEFLLQNNLNGQIDLSNVQVENIEELKFTYFTKVNKIQPVSSFFTSNNLFLSTFENYFVRDTFQLKYQTKIGSFRQFDNYLSVKLSDSTKYLSAFIKYKQAKGNFPFIYQNFKQTIVDERLNNDFKEFFAGLNVGKLLRKGGQIRLMNQYHQADKGLPGAYILYNSFASQRLYEKTMTNNLYYSPKSGKRNSGRIYLSNSNNELNYIDSSYLNEANFLKSNFLTNHTTLGLLYKFRSNKSSITTGVEEEYSTLIGSNYTQKIQRFHTKMMVNFGIELEKWNLDFLYAFQTIFNEGPNGIYQKNSFNPTISYSSKKPFPILGDFHLILKRSLRMPTFSELYYNQMGNLDLLPEIANQFSFGSYYDIDFKKQQFSYNYNVFVNSVENKIVAVPTKNLFVWSIQNLENVFIYGIESAINYHYQQKEYLITSTVNYTFQKVLNNNKTSSIYRHQIAYMPVHTANFSLNFQLKNAGFTINSNYVSMRYALNENLVSNEIKAFNTIDFSINYHFKFRNNRITCYFTTKNITNTSYQYIKNYVMPGRNYLLSINYALN